MRLGVFLLFLAILFATVSPPAVAQVDPPPLPDVEKPKPPKKPAKKPKKPIEGGEEGSPVDGEEGSPVDGEEGSPVDGEEGRPGDGEEGGNVEAGGTGAESGGGESGGARSAGGQYPAEAESLTDGSGSEDEAGPGSLVSRAGCAKDCDLPGALTDGGEGHAIRSAGPAEAAGEFEDEGVAFSASKATDTHPAVLALFALMALGLLVGLAGGLREFLGRIRGG